ncbi:twin-arginine translocation signal domain-containing protein [Paracoccus zhejiangensis]|uniref:Twin-arginine translocation pathway signal protein n=1 Tax=Paracoccus zhejiangensis TaxID=1077935 RepID=A0A2H5F268_9RHOB|nr:twin-arginine translocation signal domain-containing protein [Paracoccus zhejiangensis]AUH65626.1 twin-arginine translocation pathway signal protein [Paracoccus zhejiangensis]
MSQPKPSTRRAFLKLAGTAAPAAVAVAAIAPGEAEAAPEVKRSDRGDACMQDTAHTRTYYQLARF